MDAKVVLLDGMKFEATAESSTRTGMTMKLDASAEGGGEDAGFVPMESILLGLAGCTAMDVISILRKKRQDVTDFEVRVHAERADKHPRVFTQATIEYIVTGRNIKPEALERAMELSAETYCPAHAMLGQVMPIETKYTIQEPADEPA